MCGRFALFSNIQVILKYAEYFNSEFEWSPNYNVSPGTVVPIIISKDNKTLLVDYRWGLIPDYIDLEEKGSSGFKIINAKGETITKKTTFKGAFKSRRCLIPINGFYEWQKPDKQPFFIKLKKHKLFFLAGICNYPKPKTNNTSGNFAIITTKANRVIEPIHQRMPVIIKPEDLQKWLRNSTKNCLDEFILSNREEDMEIYPVSKEVNYSGINHPELVNKIPL